MQTSGGKSAGAELMPTACANRDSHPLCEEQQRGQCRGDVWHGHWQHSEEAPTRLCCTRSTTASGGDGCGDRRGHRYRDRPADRATFDVPNALVTCRAVSPDAPAPTRPRAARTV